MWSKRLHDQSQARLRIWNPSAYGMRLRTWIRRLQVVNACFRENIFACPARIRKNLDRKAENDPAQNGISSFMSLLRAPPPAAATRRGAGLELPNSWLPSSAPKLPPPPPLRPSSMVRFELKPCSTTSVEYFSTPLWSVHLRVCSWPSM